MRFPYRSHEVGPSPTDKSGTIWRPELEVLVRGMNHDAGELLLWGLVDIGADDCILPYDIANLIKATPFGEGYVIDYAGKPREVAYLGVCFQLELEKERISWPSIVAVDRQRTNLALWGRCGFLNHFCVTFDGPGKHFTIRRRGPAPRDSEVSRISKPKPRRRR
jgi:hypothetical protein